MAGAEGGPSGLDPNIVAALDAVLTGAPEDAPLHARIRRLVENCLADNYDTTDVRAVIELAMKTDAETDRGA